MNGPASRRGRVKVLMLVPDPRNPGGVTRMLDSWLAAGLHERVQLTCVTDTIWDASGPTKARVGLGAFARLLRAGLVPARRPDVVHLNVSLWAGLYRELVAAELARLCRLPVIAHIHSGQFFEWTESSRLARICARRMLSKATTVLVLAERWRGDAEALGAKRVAVVPHFVPPDLGTAIEAARDRPADAGNGHVRLLFYGRWSPVKGFDVLTDALSRLEAEAQTRIRLRVFGNGSRAWLDECLARAPGVATEVVGWLSDDQKPRELAECDAVVVPSRNEGFNQALLEAVMAGKPLIASAAGPVPDILAGYRPARLVPPADPEALRQAIQGLLDRSWPGPGDTGAAEVLSRYSAPLVLDHLADVYAEASS